LLHALPILCFIAVIMLGEDWSCEAPHNAVNSNFLSLLLPFVQIQSVPSSQTPSGYNVIF
jgi:hypothetical protein